MKQLDITSFPYLYQDTDINAVMSQRGSLNSPDKSILSQPAAESDVGSLTVAPGQFRYRVASDGVAFEFLLIRNDSDKLYVSLTSDVHKFYPRFMRWTYARFLGANFLCVDDPMFETYRGKCHRWYYGTSDKPYLPALLPAILKFAEQLGIKTENIIFLGSSAGAYASLYLADRVSGASAFALSPQIVPGLWRKGKYARLFERELGIRLMEEDRFGRNEIVLANPESRFFIAYNYLSAPDRVQLDRLCHNQGITEKKYGITRHENIILWLHATNGKKLHSCNPEKLELLVMQWLLDEDKAGKDISGFNSFSQVLSEYLAMKYGCIKLIEDLKSSSSTIAAEEQRKKWEKLLAREKKLRKAAAARSKKSDARNLALQKEMKAMQSSFAWRIGRMITWLPRKIRALCKGRSK